MIYHLTWPWHYLRAVSCLAAAGATSSQTPKFQQVRESGDTDFCPPSSFHSITAVQHQPLVLIVPPPINPLAIPRTYAVLFFPAGMHIEMRNKQA